jgi:hypothetical protein
MEIILRVVRSKAQLSRVVCRSLRLLYSTMVIASLIPGSLRCELVIGCI